MITMGPTLGTLMLYIIEPSSVPSLGSNSNLSSVFAVDYYN